ncbi:MAG: NUDIX domain-containing protein [Acholeplasmataceae bacterium]|nr:NUDIX domain-containing protein [Acholeplasmataceae bacterium]
MMKEKSCGAVIFRKHQNKYQYVLVQQKFGLHFGFPKGHVEKNESEIMTAYREVKEETGLDIEIYDQIREQTRYSPRPGVIKDVVYYLAKAKSHILNKQEEEIADAIWVDESEVLNKLSYSTDKKLFKVITDKIKFGS